MKMYSVLDQKAEVFMRPVFHRAHGEALRAFEVEASNPESVMCRFPEDFILFYIGEFNEQNGAITVLEPISLARATEFAGKSKVGPGDGELLGSAGNGQSAEPLSHQ